ncbi:DEAD/DEAH box helicase [Sporolactobacillus sp. CPB3-1]|uniref:DEAD/DEAH box helicase n=1 Tax=Sporolactobacillus mangiferae TaxID=2940498 RepID=A0ABT0M8E1_9BACL|nr:DEAD/DEAH box helicase [Sporolactobacillus mangiferae]MCL1631142.1 DEAD/DEAH box helicase [Sporolactobacillus mangiferae]
MDRLLQMTFLPHIEHTWNFFIWFTGRDGRALPFPNRLQHPDSFPAWLEENSSFPFLPYKAKFVDEKTVVEGAIMPMAGAYRLIRSNAVSEYKNALYPGKTIQWFRQISEAVDILLEKGLFYPYFYHLKRGRNEQCFYCHWMPDTRTLTESGLFADWLRRLPQLAFSIDRLQDQKVQQWLYLIFIYWLNALIRARHKTSLSDESPAVETHDILMNKITNGNPLSGTEEPWLITADPSLIKEAERFELEMAGWIQPVLSAQSDSWSQALLSYKREQAERFFRPEAINIVLRPENPDDPFSMYAIWDYEIQIAGWQNGKRVNRSMKEAEELLSLDPEHWFSKQLTIIKKQVPEAVYSLLKDTAEGHLSVQAISQLYEYAQALETASIHVLFPDHLTIRHAEPVTVDLDIRRQDTEKDAALFSLHTLISYDWRIAIGDIELSAEKFRQLVKTNRPFIKKGNQWIHLSYGQLRQTYEEITDTMNLIGTKAVAASALKIEAARRRKRNSAITVHLDKAFGSYLHQLLKMPTRTLPLPDNFIGNLRPYQKKGYTWLVNLRHRHVGGCLADDMGLGKTVQTIAYLDHCKQQRQTSESASSAAPSLIICPTSLVANWKHECAVFSPQLDLYIHHGIHRLHGTALLDRLRTCDVAVTSYAIYTKEAAQLLTLHWNSVILDEAQAIKNPHAQKTRALRMIQAEHRLALTGTPIENRLEELWSIMDFLNPGYLGTLDRFRTRFIHPIEKKNSRSKSNQLTQIIRPFLLRREKTDKRVIRDLPEKMETKQICNLTKRQASLYQSIVNKLEQTVSETGGIRRKGLILSALTKLKQVCDHPALVSDQPDSSVNAQPASGKLNLLFHLLDPLFQQNEKVLLFTQYVKMGKILQAEVQNRYPDMPVFFLHGGLSGEQRQKMIDRFQNSSPQKMLFILSLKAGGVGINLTAARYVVHYDRWWNPAVEEQATDRAYRIGQKRNIYVYKLICEGTLEEQIDLLIERKKGLQKQILSGSDSWLTEMSDQELLQLIQLHEGAV